MSELLTESEYDTLIRTAYEMNPLIKEEEILKIVRWAEQTRIDQTFLGLIFKGMLHPKIGEDGEIAFGVIERVREYLEQSQLLVPTVTELVQ